MSTAKECADIARKTFDAYNAHDLDAIESMYAEDSETLTVPTGERYLGNRGAREDVARWFKAFPDLKFELLDLIAGENGATLELRSHGTHNGPLALPEGELPATGKSVETRICVVMRVKDGKISSEHDYFDVAGMMEQLGVSSKAEPSRAAEDRPSA